MNKVWFVTGAGRGLGAAIAKAALADGDRVVVSGRRLESLHSVFAEYGEQVLAVALEVSDAAQALAAVEAAVARFGRIDVLVGVAHEDSVDVVRPRAGIDVALVRQGDDDIGLA